MNKILQYISIAAKAGKVFGGEMQTESRIRSKSAKIVIVAEDASDNTKNRIIKLAEHSGIPVVTVPDRKASVRHPEGISVLLSSSRTEDWQTRYCGAEKRTRSGRGTFKWQ